VSHREVEKRFVLQAHSGELEVHVSLVMIYLSRNVRNPLNHVEASFEIKQTFSTEFQPYPEVDILDIRNIMVRYHLEKPESQVTGHKLRSQPLLSLSATADTKPRIWYLRVLRNAVMEGKKEGRGGRAHATQGWLQAGKGGVCRTCL
jgi:hypothetical protein